MKNKYYCSDCCKEIYRENKRCWNCYCKWIKVPENNSNYKDGKSKQKVSKYGTMNDRSNSTKYRKNLSKALMGHIPWNKGKKGLQKNSRKGISNEPNHFCIDCNKPLAKYSKAIRCLSCAIKYLYKVGRLNFSGKNNPNYKDGRTNKWREVRNKCFKRDDYQCKLCNNQTNRYLNAHHIINRHICKDKFDINNLITLCRECHNYITQIEMTERYIEYKKLFQSYIQENLLI